MRMITALLLVIFSSLASADVKISDLPLGTGSAVLTNDSFPYVDTSTASTKRLRISDIANVPSFIAGIASSLGRTVSTVSANVSIPILTKDYILNVNTSSGPVTVTLPSASSSTGFCIDIKNIGSPSYAVTVNPTVPQLIDGSSSNSVDLALDSKHYCAVSGNWFIY